LTAAQTLVSAAAAYNAHNRHMSCAYFLREDLLLPKDSPYWKVIENGNDMAYWQMMRTDKAKFDLICEYVDASLTLWRDGYEDAGGTRRRGRPNMLDARGVIALTLTWLGSDGPNNRLLEQIFGVGHSVTDRDLHVGRNKDPVRIAHRHFLQVRGDGLPVHVLAVSHNCLERG